MSQFHLHSDLEKIFEWAYQWKKLFNPDISNQTQEVIFSRKAVKASKPAVFFNDIPVTCFSIHKHLGMYLDEKLNFDTGQFKKLFIMAKGTLDSTIVYKQ